MYFLAVRPQINGDLLIHRDGCPFRPAAEKRIYLGRFKTVYDALKASQKHFPDAACCPFCSKHRQRGTKSHEIKNVKSRDPVTFNQLAIPFECAFMFSLN